MKTYQILSALAFAAVLQPGMDAMATEAVSNLSETRTGGTGVSSILWVGQQFTTGTSAAGSVKLDSVVARLSVPLNSDASGFTLRLYSDNATPNGGTLLATLTGADASGDTFASYAYTPPSDIFLSDNTSYWLVASAASSGAFDWGRTSSDNETGLLGWSMGDSFKFSFTSGVSWFDEADPNSLQVEVNISEVPEPSTYAAGLLLAGAVGGLWWRRRAR